MIPVYEMDFESYAKQINQVYIKNIFYKIMKDRNYEAINVNVLIDEIKDRKNCLMIFDLLNVDKRTIEEIIDSRFDDYEIRGDEVVNIYNYDL